MMALLLGLATLWFWCLGLVVTVRWTRKQLGSVLPALPSLRRGSRRVR